MMMTIRMTMILLLTATLLGLFSSTGVTGVPLSGRILGGEDATSTGTPYAGSFRVDNAHVCGCTIIDTNKVLTAAHCVKRDGTLLSADRLSVRVGSTNQYAGGRVISVSEVVAHPEHYNEVNNLAVVTLASTLEWTERIKAVTLASGDDDLPAVDTPITVAGWGRTVDNRPSFKIQEIALPLTDDEECTEAYSGHDQRSFCLSHELQQGICYGDGGGAAMSNGILVGVANFVVGACGNRYPDVFIRIAAYSEWIQSVIG